MDEKGQRSNAAHRAIENLPREDGVRGRVSPVFALVAFAIGFLSLTSTLADAQRTETLHLYGSASGGWGTSPQDLQGPGPTVTFDPGTELTLLLSSQDDMTHNFFIDYSGNGEADVGEPRSLDFSVSDPPLSYQVTLDREGRFTYYCEYHQWTMRGTIIVGTPTDGGSVNGQQPANPAVIAILLGAPAVAVALVALVLRGRASRR